MQFERYIEVGTLITPMKLYLACRDVYLILFMKWLGPDETRLTLSIAKPILGSIMSIS